MRGSEAGTESPPESFSKVDRTPFRNLVGAAAEETYKGKERAPRSGLDLQGGNALVPKRQQETLGAKKI